MDLVGRAYFFGGLVVLVFFLILTMIADPSQDDYAAIENWGILGMMAACISITLALEHFLAKRGRVTSWPLVDTSVFAPSRFAWKFVVKSFVLAVVCLIAAGLVVIWIYGDNAYRTIIVENASLYVVVNFLFSLALIILAESVRRQSKEHRQIS